MTVDQIVQVIRSIDKGKAEDDLRRACAEAGVSVEEIGNELVRQGLKARSSDINGTLSLLNDLDFRISEIANDRTDCGRMHQAAATGYQGAHYSGVRCGSTPSRKGGRSFHARCEKTRKGFD